MHRSTSARGQLPATVAVRRQYPWLGSRILPAGEAYLEHQPLARGLHLGGGGGAPMRRFAIALGLLGCVACHNAMPAGESGHELRSTAPDRLRAVKRRVRPPLPCPRSRALHLRVRREPGAGGFGARDPRGTLVRHERRGTGGGRADGLPARASMPPGSSSGAPSRAPTASACGRGRAPPGSTRSPPPASSTTARLPSAPTAASRWAGSPRGRSPFASPAS